MRRADRPALTANKKVRPWYFRGWAWCLWVVLTLVIIIGLISLSAWNNRYELIRRAAIQELANRGLDADLQIESLSRTRAVLQDVSLAQNGEQFLHARRVYADYQWRDAIQGVIEGVSFDRLSASISVDESGKITDGWLPPGQSRADGPTLPKNGITLTDSDIELRTPYGIITATGDAQIMTLSDWSADVIIGSKGLSGRNISSGAISGQAKITADGSGYRFDGRTTLAALSHPAIGADDLFVQAKGTIPTSRDRADFDALSAEWSELSSQRLSSGTGRLNWQGAVKRVAINPNAQDGRLGLDGTGDWSADITALTVSDTEFRAGLIEALSLSEPLSVAPIAQNFAPDLRRRIAELLVKMDVSGRGQLKRENGVTAITLSQPATLLSAGRTVTLSPREGATLLRDREAGTLSAYMDVATGLDTGLRLQGLKLATRSGPSWQFEGVDRFSAQLVTQRDWYAKGIDGRPARLGPITSNIRFSGPPMQRHLSLNGQVDYDGLLPGGYATGLRVYGLMELRTGRGNLDVSLKPTPETRLNMASFETSTGWKLIDFEATLDSERPLYTRITGGAEISADLGDVRFQAIREADGAGLDIQTSRAAAKATLDGTGGAPSQDWIVDFSNAQIESETIPAAGTQITLPSGQLTTRLIDDTAPQFTLNAPSSDITTNLLIARGMALDIAGTPTAYSVAHSGGQAQLSQNDLPAMPIEGQMRFVDGAFTGTAKARLPKSNVPVDLSYTLRDGVGDVDVTITALQFKPKSLQPQDLVQAFQGKIAQVDGTVDAQIKLHFAPDQPLESYGQATLNNLSFGTAPGPLSGVTTTLEFDSILPLISRGRQRMTVKRFNPGLVLEDGEIEYELIDGGVQVHRARWPIGPKGFFSLDPFTWRYAAKENRMILRVDNIDIGDFLASIGNKAVEATGQLDGAFPIVIEGVNVLVENGRIEVKEGGVIRYESKGTDAVAEENEFAGMAFEALKEFRYQYLGASLDGPLDGNMSVQMKFDGKNDKVLNGQPFAFNVNVTGELINILRSFNTREQTKTQILNRREAAPDLESLGLEDF